MEPNREIVTQKRRRRIRDEESDGQPDEDPNRPVSERRALIISTPKKPIYKKHLFVLYPSISLEQEKEDLIFEHFGTFPNFMQINSCSTTQNNNKIGILFDHLDSTLLSWDTVLERLTKSSNEDLNKIAEFANILSQVMIKPKEEKKSDHELIPRSANYHYLEYLKFKEECFAKFPSRSQSYVVDDQGYRLNNFEVNELFIKAVGYNKSAFMSTDLNDDLLNLGGRLSSDNKLIKIVLQNLMINEGFQHLCTATQYLYNEDGIGVPHKTSIYICFLKQVNKILVEVIMIYEKLEGTDIVEDIEKKVQADDKLLEEKIKGMVFNNIIKNYYEKEYEEFIKKYRVK